jgi:hypothetical protein
MSQQLSTGVASRNKLYAPLPVLPWADLQLGPNRVRLFQACLREGIVGRRSAGASVEQCQVLVELKLSHGASEPSLALSHRWHRQRARLARACTPNSSSPWWAGLGKQ